MLRWIEASVYLPKSLPLSFCLIWMITGFLSLEYCLFSAYFWFLRKSYCFFSHFILHFSCFIESSFFIFGCAESLLLAGFSLVVVRGLPIVVASCGGAWALGVRAPVVVEHGFSCPMACEIFLDQGLNRIGRRVLYPWTTREVQFLIFISHSIWYLAFLPQVWGQCR